MVPPSTELLPSAAPSSVHHFVATPQGVEGAVPLLQLEGLHLDAGVLGGLALGVGEVGGGEAIGDEHEHAVGEVAEALEQAELMPQAAQGEEGAEVEGVEGDGVIGGGRLVAATEFEDAVEALGEEVLAAERDDGAAGGAAVFPDGFAEVDVLIARKTHQICLQWRLNSC